VPVVVVLALLGTVWLVCAGASSPPTERGRSAHPVREICGHGARERVHWANPFYLKRKVSLRRRNLNGATIKVNDLRGNPIEIAAVMVWRVADAPRPFSTWTI
jgi:hypothetical protein